MLTLLALLLALSGAGAERLRIADATGSDLAAFGNAAFAFATQNDVEIAYHRLDAATALEKLSFGETDLVILKTEDIPKDFSGVKTVCACRPLVAVVNRGNPLRGLTRNHLKRLLTEPQPRWDFRGGSGKFVRRVALKGRDGKPAGFGQLNLFKSAPGIIVLDSVEELRRFVGANVEALAVMPSAADLPDTLIALKVDGVAPTRANIRGGSYPLTETFAAVTAPEAPGTAREILRRFGGRDFSDLLEEEGALAPLPQVVEAASHIR